MEKKKSSVWLPALICVVVLTVITGIVYPLIVTGISQVAFHKQANGSIITIAGENGEPVNIGSELIGQEFTQPRYLIGRPTPGAPTNLSPVSEEQAAAVEERVAWLHSLDPDNTAEIPMDLVTVSGSGVDPHISPEGAEYQVPRIARERGMSEDEVREVIAKHTEGRQFGIFGEPRVNVLMVNLDLDGKLPQ